MDYIQKQKYSFTNHPYRSILGAKVLMFDDQPENIALYSRHFQDAKIELIIAEKIEELVKHALEVVPDVIVINPTNYHDDSYKQIAFIKIKLPHLPIITIGESIRDDSLDVIMQLGVSFYLDKNLTRPRDLLIAIEQTLNPNN